MTLGYARVSTSEQDMQAQRAALLAVGCERVFGEGASCLSPTESVDTSTSAGRMLMLGKFSEFERSMLRERTQLVGVSRSTVSRLQSRICRNEVSWTSLRR